MANGRFPDITGQEYDPLWARQMAEQDIPRVPAQVQQAPDLNIGPVRLNGAGLDSAALAVLGALQNQRQPHNALGSFAQGLAGGLAGGRVRSMQSRQAANEDERKRVVGDDIERRKQAAAYGRSLAQHRWDMQRDAAKEAMKKPAPDDTTTLTAEMRDVAAKKGVFFPVERVGKPVKWSELTLKKDPLIDELRRSSIEKNQGSLSDESAEFIGGLLAAGADVPYSLMRGLTGEEREKVTGSWNRQSGSGYNAAMAKARYKANSASLTGLTKTANAANAFASMIDKNIGVLNTVIGQVKETNNQWTNGPVRSFVGKLGDVPQAQFNFALKTLVPEITRIIQSPGLTGVLTVDAQKDIRAVLNGNFTIPQLEGVLKIVQMDKQNRLDAYNEVINGLNGTGAGGETPNAPPVVEPKGAGKSWLERNKR